MNRIAIFYHGLFFIDSQPLPKALGIILNQMEDLSRTGLMAAASHICVGINGSGESAGRIKMMRLPPYTRIVMHGLHSRSENLTLVEIEKWIPTVGDDWYVLYFHSKGICHEGPAPGVNERWRNCMMRHCIENWRQCVADLDAGAESVGCHWMPGMADGTQNIWAGNFWWAKSSFLRTLPSIFDRARIKESGIGSLESRYESEVWIGNGPRLPIIKDYHPEGYRLCP